VPCPFSPALASSITCSFADGATARGIEEGGTYDLHFFDPLPWSESLKAHESLRKIPVEAEIE
jgi:hypothetical protein